MRLLNLLVVFALFTSFAAQGAYEVKRRDLKLPNQKLLRHQLVSDPALGTGVEIANDWPGDTSGAATGLPSFAAQPDVPRKVVFTPVGDKADIKAGNISLAGTDFHGNAISETISIADDQGPAVTSAYAYKTVTSIIVPLEDSPYAGAWDIGYGDQLGFDRCMDADLLALTTFASAYESTRPSVTYDASVVAENTFDPNSTLDGSSDADVYFIENYRCSP